MGSNSMKVRIRFIEEYLGTASGDEQLHDSFIASKAPDALTREEEIEALGVEWEIEKGMTVFARMDDGSTPLTWDYQVRGYFKEVAGALKKASSRPRFRGWKVVDGQVTGGDLEMVDKVRSKDIKTHKKAVDNLVFVFPRKIELHLPKGKAMGDCQRSLRASTAQGERVALAHSETVPAGTTAEFEVVVLQDDLMPVVEEWLDYGYLKGLGQWRNSGKGRFVWERIEDEATA